MADRYGFELFDAGGSNPRVRWRIPDGPVTERGLDRDVVQGLARQAEVEYKATAPDLPGLGARLYEWLDGATQRWVQAARDHLRPMVLYIDGDEALRGLPWEVMFRDGFVTVHPSRPVSPVRVASRRVSDPRGMANRPLRVLFMASSPLAVQPVLNYEQEEAAILDAAAGRVEVVVEESGSLDGLTDVLVSYPPGYFDVLHLSGHGYIGPDGPRFVMERSDGGRADASAEELAAATRGHWPGLVFVSGCYTAGAPREGLVASMAEALVDAGAPAVLGWALPVGDVSANRLAAVLYRELAGGADVWDAVAAARRALFEIPSPYWHLLRLYADHSPVEPMVTAPLTPGRVRLRVRATEVLFLDPAGKVKVTGRAGFVGRRRELQHLLRVLRPEDPTTGPQIAVVYGLGGLGKSTLTARLLDRMRPTHRHHAVWVGRIDETSVTTLTGRLEMSDPDMDQKVNELLNRPNVPLADRVRYVLAGPLADEACVFVFDDFENANLEPDGTGGFRCTPSALAVLSAFAAGIARTGSPSRVVVTSRHHFPLGPDIRVVTQPLSGLDGNDLDKKVRLTNNLGPTSSVNADLRSRAVSASAGIPRLLERMDELVAADGDVSAVLSRIEDTKIDYREELLLEQLLGQQTSSVRRAIALAAVYQIAVPIEAMEALSPDQPIRNDLDTAGRVGLIQAGIHPTTGETRYLVSPLLVPLLDGIAERLDADELRQAQTHGAQYLYQRWVHDE